MKEADETEMEDYIKQRAKIQYEKRKKKEMERKEAMAIPVAPLPDKELCAYEQFRADNIKERKAAMAECKFFDSLNCLKKDIGLIANDKKDEDRENRKEKKAKEVYRSEVSQNRKES